MRFCICLMVLMGLLSGCSAQGLQPGDSYTPAPIVYNPASKDINDAAKQRIAELLSTSNEHKPMSPTLMCGPGLWEKIKKHPSLRLNGFANLKINIPEVNNGIVQSVEMLDGKLLQRTFEIHWLWDAFKETYDFHQPWTIRKLNSKEKERFWSMVPFDSIDEPIFIAEGTNFKLLFFFVHYETNYLPLWVDDFYNI